MPWNISNPSLLPYLPRLLIIGHFDHHLYVKVETIPRALSEDELIEKIQGVHVLCIRSKTKVSARVIERANALLAIGCFCIGTDQVDIEAARNVAIPVFNSPFSNCRSVAEMVIGELIMLARQLGDRNTEMHQNLWNKVPIVRIIQACFYFCRRSPKAVMNFEERGLASSDMAKLDLKCLFWPKR